MDLACRLGALLLLPVLLASLAPGESRPRWLFALPWLLLPVAIVVSAWDARGWRWIPLAVLAGVLALGVLPRLLSGRV